jgi:hypothetical protein
MSDEFLICSSCGEPERKVDAHVFCLPCGDAMVFEANVVASQLAALKEALKTARNAALSGMAMQHLDRAGIFNDPPHGIGKFAECEAPWCKRNQDKLARWDALLPTPSYVEVRTTACHAGSDGDCIWTGCPQDRDGEPAKSGRICPLLSHDPTDDFGPNGFDH